MTEKDTSKLTNKNNVFYYAFFAVISFIIIPLIIIFVLHSNLKIAGLPMVSGFGLILIFLNYFILISIICILFFVIFIILLLKKSFQPIFLFIPFIITFITENYFVYLIYENLYIGVHNLDTQSVIFFVKMNLLFLPFSYIPFIILFSIISICKYIKNKAEQKELNAKVISKN